MTTAPRVFVPFFIGSLLLTLTFGATLGMINLARLTAGWGLGVLPRPSVWAHGYVQVFGFMALFIMGVAYHVLPRFVGGTLQNARLVPWSFWLQLAGVVTIACGFFHDGAATQPIWIAGTTSLLAAAAIFCTVVLRTLRAGAPSREPFRRWIAAGALWLVIASVLALTAAITGDVTWHRVLWTAALFGFISSWIFGVGRRILPIFLGCQPRWPHLERRVFILYQLGAGAWVVAAWPNADWAVLDVIRVAGAIVLITAVMAYTACLGLLTRAGPLLGLCRAQPAGRLAEVRLRRLGMAVCRPRARARLDVRAAIYGRRRIGAGVLTSRAMRSRLVSPRRWCWASRAGSFRTSPATRCGARAGAMPRSICSTPAWWSVRWKCPSVSASGPGAWNLIAWSGPLGVMAMLIFALNIALTVRQQPSPILRVAAPALGPLANSHG